MKKRRQAFDTNDTSGWDAIAQIREENRLNHSAASQGVQPGTFAGNAPTAATPATFAGNAPTAVTPVSNSVAEIKAALRSTVDSTTIVNPDNGVQSVPKTTSRPVATGGNSLVGMAINIGKRSYQQDAIISSDPNVSGKFPDRWMATLCDGMGGMNGGEKASALGVKMSKESFEAYTGEDFPTYFRTLVEKMDYDVCSLEDEKGNFLGAGSTFISMIYNKGMWHFASVGDSHIYIIRDGVINMVIHEHNYLQDLLEMVRQGEITLEEAYADKSKEALTSYIGMGGVSLIDTNSAVAKPGDIIVLCSDGLYRTCSDAEIMSGIMANLGDMQAAANYLINFALSKNNPYQDNLSVILGRLI